MRPPYRSSRKHSSQVIEVADRYSPGIQAGDPFFTSEPIWADWFDLHHDARQHLKRTAVRWLRVWWEQGHHCTRLPFFYIYNRVQKQCGVFSIKKMRLNLGHHFRASNSVNEMKLYLQQWPSNHIQPSVSHQQTSSMEIQDSGRGKDDIAGRHLYTWHKFWSTWIQY